MAAAFVVGGSGAAFAAGTSAETPPARTDGTRVTQTTSADDAGGAGAGTDNREYGTDNREY
ncbi:hypothetical protein EHYA_04639 [Embleya hyalina]|uniref:Uncharacterized protein n=1 Tax=Embleya hyalina TaxID=516124 RepID=A0A401YQS8_9ACTN|nr:hypothetical protein EHYA_04639 [Embleya hyalina]